MSARAAVKQPARITLLTDFGTRDGYVAAMRGVIASLAPQALVEDASHDVPAGDVTAGAWALGNYWRLYPEGTVHVAVIDPGVGSERRALAAEVDGRFFVAPDNGVLTRVLVDAGGGRLVGITEQAYQRAVVSNTFHGRDIFAPAAAHLSLGLDLEKLGPVAERIQRIDAPSPRVTREGVIMGEVVSIDHFGNLVTNIPGEQLASADTVEIRIGKATIPGLSRSYKEGKAGQLIALVGSTGNLEVSVNKGDARKKTGAEVGSAVRVRHTQE